MGSVAIPRDAKVSNLPAIQPGEFFVHGDKACLRLTFKDWPALGCYLPLDTTWGAKAEQSVFAEYVVLPVTRGNISIEGYQAGLPKDRKPGDLITDEDGTWVVVSHWEHAAHLMMANLASGLLKYIKGSEPPANYVEKWTFRGWQKEGLSETPVLQAGTEGQMPFG
ncbi:hypothetical protein [Luteibacter sp.]|jgi:hypothetical protein|uniref:hypothetical protein n=1 Tax=Luteibacter sp. TaxID=1886636 RepID=UPI002F3F280A